MNPGSEKGYALDFLSVVRHVATEMEAASPGAASITDMARSYHHANQADLGRVCRHHGLPTDDDAILFLVERAVAALGKQVESDGEGKFRLAVPFDSLRYERKKLYRIHSIHTQFRAPFDPMSGAFSENIRAHLPKDDAELRWSLKTWGWLKELPGYRDEFGVVLVGNRRLAICEQEGIEPYILTITVGNGDAADAHRLALALASNLGQAPLSKTDRKRIARHLYGDAEWTMERIAEALKVSTSTVERDLRDFPGLGKSPQSKGKGRPKKLTPVQEQQIGEMRYDQGRTRAEIVAATGLTEKVVQLAMEREGARREERARLAEPTPPNHATPVEDVKPALCRCPTCGHEHTLSG